MAAEGTGETFTEAVTRFVFACDAPEEADIIFVPGSSHAGNTLLAAQLYHRGLAPRILPSGFHAMTETAFGDPAFPSEWAWMRSILLTQGVPEEAILREDRATFTWQNALFSRQVTDSLGLPCRRAILCCRPFHARRAAMYYQTAFPETKLIICPCAEPGLDRDDWFLTREGRERVLGEVRRLGDQIRNEYELMMTGRRDGQ